MLFKDEARAVASELGLPDSIVWRHPFPGPGLAIRILGEVTEERLDTLKQADKIFMDELNVSGLYRELSQALAVLAPIRSVGVMGDQRTYAHPIILRAVVTEDFMTARWAQDTLRCAGTHQQPYRQRGCGYQSRGLRHQFQTSGDYRVGMTAKDSYHMTSGVDA